MKQITGIYTAPSQHWVSDGFPVRSMFSYQTHGEQLSPFLLLDYAGSHHFPAGTGKRGVGEHPHRGADLKPSPWSIPARLNIVTLPAEAASLGRAMCSG